ncbi:MAG: hypothetical protein JXR76_13365 [Deltaproteobacteria bacterium]|nr:hypothetical protein [Deltaproteobacteria bacterium]
MAIEKLSDICFKQEQDGNITRFYCRISDTFYGFEGHFENQPILPGVCQLQLVVEGVTSITSRAPSIQSVDRMKFQNLILPGGEFILELESMPNAWQYRLYGNDHDFASGKMVLR